MTHSLEDRVEAVRVIYHREADGWWAESPDVKGWSAAGGSYAEVVKLAEEGIPFALERPAELEHYVPADERIPA
jgi:predicted RNase H-like HicB family nuclease